MLRNLMSSALRTTWRAPVLVNTQRACFSHLQQVPAEPQRLSVLPGNNLVPLPQKLLQLVAPAAHMQPPTRSVTKFSLIKGKRKTVKAVVKRFKRLDWGAWIRTHSGRQKKLFKKSAALKRRLRQHVFTNATQSWLLDKMVTKFWRRPKHYIDDPYAPYHKRDEYFATKRKSFKV